MSRSLAGEVLWSSAERVRQREGVIEVECRPGGQRTLAMPVYSKIQIPDSK